MFLDKIKNIINNAEIVSFDIFDTLLLRPYAKPTDLFKHLSIIHKIENFDYDRIEAEKQSRKRTKKEDVTIDEIYNNIPQELKYLKEKELKLERQVLTVNKEIKEIFDYAIKNNKDVIICSDMYLPKDFLIEVLKEKGYVGFKNLYVSGEVGKSKYKGTLYKHIIKEYNINPNKIVHIGDNYNDDYKCPKSLGIKAVYYEKAIYKLFKVNNRAKIFFNYHQNSLSASIILGMNAILFINERIDIKKDYWKYFGAIYGGPISFAFMEWIDFQVKENAIENLLFIARDGFVLQKVYNIIKTTNTDFHYIYASRKMSLACTLDYKTRIIASEFEGITTLQSLINSYCEYKNCNTIKIYSVEDGVKFIKEHQNELKDMAYKYSQDYKEYISKFNTFTKKTAIVDTISSFFGAQKLIEHVLNKKILGLYWIVNLSFFETANLFYNYKSFDKSEHIQIKDWNIIEFLISSNEPPIDKLKKDIPIYKDINSYERTRISLYPSIEEGILCFAKYKKQIFKDIPLNMNNNIITDWINMFCKISTCFEKKEFSKIKFAIDAEHKKYIKIPNWFGLKNNIEINFFKIKNNLKIKKNKLKNTILKIKKKIVKITKKD